jgi:hypothetical protein
VETKYGGKAGATNKYSSKYNPMKAFKGSSWLSKFDPKPPVLLWFRFHSPTRIVEFSFERVSGFRKRYSPESADDYEFFGSNAASCENITWKWGQYVTLKRTSEETNGSIVTATVSNESKFSCYGFKILKISDDKYASIKNVQFWEGEIPT